MSGKKKKETKFSKNVFALNKYFPKTKNKLSLAFLAVVLLAIGSITVYGVLQLLHRLGYELDGPYTWDTTTYWAVGRGLLNGLKPYVDMFESKSPGIYFISALSVLFTGDFAFTHLLQVLVILIIFITPLLFLYINRRKFPFKENIAFISLLGGAFGIVVALFAAERSGEVQVESFGAAFACIYMLFISNSDPMKTGAYLKSKKFIGASVFLLFAIGMKEPFIFTCFACAVLFSKRFIDLWKSFILPLVFSGVIGVIVLIITGVFGPYTQFYLPYMVGNKASSFGSPWERGLKFDVLLKDLGNFSSGLGILILILFALVVINEFYRLGKEKTTDIRTYVSGAAFLFFKVAIIAYLPMFAVGLGGYFYNHYYVFAVPMYVALFLYIMKEILYNFDAPVKKVAYLLLAVVIGICTINLPKFDYDYRMGILRNAADSAKIQAEYVDQVLDAKGLDTYLFIGPNGPQVYSYTKHSPQGPMFFQLHEYFPRENEKFRRLFMEQVKEASLVVFEQYCVADLHTEVQQYLDSNFSQSPWEEVKHISRQTDRYIIYYRK